jgi:hypothetical protein
MSYVTPKRWREAGVIYSMTLIKGKSNVQGKYFLEVKMARVPT